MFQWVSKLLHWRQNNPVIIQGTQTQFVPYKGVYVIARQYGGRTSLTIINGRNAAGELDVARYAEVIAGHDSATDVITGAKVDLSRNLTLEPRQALVIEF
jgi:hypothetical protein